jgi:hypothetical protein
MSQMKIGQNKNYHIVVPKLDVEKKKFTVYHSGTNIQNLGNTIRFNVRIPADGKEKVIKDVILKASVDVNGVGVNGWIQLINFWQLTKNLVKKINGVKVQHETDHDLMMHLVENQHIVNGSESISDLVKKYQEYCIDYDIYDNVAVKSTAPYDGNVARIVDATSKVYCTSLLNLFPELENLPVSALEPNREDQIYFEFQLIKESTQAGYTKYLQYLFDVGAGPITGLLHDALTVSDMKLEIIYDDHINSVPKQLGTIRHLRKEWYLHNAGEFGTAGNLTKTINLKNAFPSINNIGKIWLMHFPYQPSSTAVAGTETNNSGHPLENKLSSVLSKITLKKNGNIFYEWEDNDEIFRWFDISHQSNFGHKSISPPTWTSFRAYTPYIDLGVMFSDVWNDSDISHKGHIKTINGLNLNTNTYEITIELGAPVFNAHDGYRLFVACQQDRVVEITGKKVSISATTV